MISSLHPNLSLITVFVMKSTLNFFTPASSAEIYSGSFSKSLPYIASNSFFEDLVAGNFTWISDLVKGNLNAILEDYEDEDISPKLAQYRKASKQVKGSKIPTTLEEVKQAYGEVPANVKFEFGDTLKVYFNGTAEDTVSYVDKIKKDLGDLVSVTNKPKGFFTESAKDGDLVLEKIETKEGYDYYIGVDTDGSYVYNVVREGIPAPKTGYYRSQYICDLRGVPNIFDEFEKEGTRTEDTISDPRQ